TGFWALDREEPVPLREFFDALSQASGELWWNFKCLFSENEPHWDFIISFHHEFMVPYLLGGAINGAILAVICYLTAHVLIGAYQRRRSRFLQKRLRERLASGPVSPAE
ncbi:MAG: DUF2062 domain-containing protein, partial [Pseudomonadota bacterium]